MNREIALNSGLRTKIFGMIFDYIGCLYLFTKLKQIFTWNQIFIQKLVGPIRKHEVTFDIINQSPVSAPGTGSASLGLG